MKRALCDVYTAQCSAPTNDVRHLPRKSPSTTVVMVTCLHGYRGGYRGYLSPLSVVQLSSRLVAMQSVSSAGGGGGVQSSVAGSADCPWSVSVQRGQRVNVTITLLPARTQLTSSPRHRDVTDRSAVSTSGPTIVSYAAGAPQNGTVLFLVLILLL